MVHDETESTAALLAADGLDAAQFGLRFDRVVKRVLGEMTRFVEQQAPPGVVVIVTLAAPIRSPARTVADLKLALLALLGAHPPQRDWRSDVNGNAVRVRITQGAADQAAKCIGFVHKSASAPDRLLDAAETWVRKGL